MGNHHSKKPKEEIPDIDAQKEEDVAFETERMGRISVVAHNDDVGKEFIHSFGGNTLFQDSPEGQAERTIQTIDFCGIRMSLTIIKWDVSAYIHHGNTDVLVMLFDPSSKDEDFESHMNSKLDGLASGIDLPFVYLVGWRNNDTTNWVPCVERKSSNNHRQCEWVDINSNDDTAKHEFVGKLLHALLPVLGKQVIVAKSARKT